MDRRAEKNYFRPGVNCVRSGLFVLWSMRLKTQSISDMLSDKVIMFPFAENTLLSVKFDMICIAGYYE